MAENKEENKKPELKQKPVMKRKEISYKEVQKEDPEILRRMRFG
tara:strand:- start:1421 stop:1552 length:132 start_codon:yes stop_codon:yes gene_type:complete